MSDTPALKLLQDGIWNKDWDLVIEGFEKLTGIELYHKIPESKSKIKPKKAKATKKPAEPLTEEVEDYNNEFVEYNVVKTKDKKSKTKVNSTINEQGNDKQCARRLPYDAKKVKRIGNKFKDTGSIAKADKKIDKLLFQEPLVERSRKSSIVKATCCICHKTHSVNKSLIYNGKYRCNNCCMGGRS